MSAHLVYRAREGTRQDFRLRSDGKPLEILSVHQRSVIPETLGQPQYTVAVGGLTFAAYAHEIEIRTD